MRRVVEAADYNLVRLALARLGNPLRLELVGDLCCLEVWLGDDYWLCRDACRGQQPMLAWTSFELAARSGLHQPVACELHFYHHHAGLVMGEVLQSIRGELEARLGAPGA